MLKKKSALLVMLLLSCLFIFSGCAKEDSIIDDVYSEEDAQALIAEIVPNDLPELDLESIHLSFDGEVEVDGEVCYSIIVYENNGEKELAIAYYAVKKDGTNWYRLNVETDEYEIGASG